MREEARGRIVYSDQRYDLHVLPPGKASFSVEVKWDMRAAETGHLYFEIENTRQHRSSGIVWIELPTVEAFFGELFHGAAETDRVISPESPSGRENRRD